MSQAAAPTPGFPCPRCRGFIPVSVGQLLAEPTLHCPHCQLELAIDQGASGAGLAELRKLQQRLAAAQDQSGSPKLGGWE